MKKVIYFSEAPTMRVGTPEKIAQGAHPDAGFNRTFLSKEVNGSTDLSMGIWTMKPGEIHPLHHHPGAAEIYYIMSGSALFTVDEEVVDGTPGTAIYLPVNCKHRVEVHGDETLVFMWAYNKPDFKEVGMVWDE